MTEAARLIRAGQLVAFPTETVYGLGANALDPAAVERVFAAKGRPFTSPLIVHVDSFEMAKSLVSEWPAAAETLATRFWPGPLTLVLPKQPHVPDRVTANLPTVGVRMPDHPVALELIREAGVPIAAPSANRFTGLSPTTAGHVRQAFDNGLSILDGGPSALGLESTVLSLCAGRRVLLRPGIIGREELEALIGPIEQAPDPVAGPDPSPGLRPHHYRPRTPLFLIADGQLPPKGKGAYLWLRDNAPVMNENVRRLIEMPIDPRQYAAALYSTLHELDEQGWDWIAVEQPPHGSLWAAVNDRLSRAATS